MRSKRTKRFRALFDSLPEAAQRQANEAYRLFRQDPFHSSLQFKPIESSDERIYSVRVGNRYRALGTRESDDLIVWYWIGSHEAYNHLV